MQKEQIKKNFDQQAASYDQQWSKLAPIRDALHLLIGAVFAHLPEDARILSVGAGTGAEIMYLADKFPRWRFTIVEPSSAMLEVCRSRAEENKFADRCFFHEGYLDSLPSTEDFDAATSLLVSQFILDEKERTDFFSELARRLRSGTVLVSSDLASDLNSVEYQSLLNVWLEMMKITGMPDEGLERMRSVYGRDVAVLPPDQIEALIATSGFKMPVQFYQAGLIHAWYSKRV